MFDLVIKNAKIYDGTGESAYVGNIGVNDGKIAVISQNDLGLARENINADGLALSAGFIDAHSHSDLAIWDDPHRSHVLRMGVTTEIAGQCGSSISPATSDMPDAARRHFEKELYPDMKTEIEALSKMELGTNQRYFCGHNVVRGCVMGLENRLPTKDEIARMEELIEASVRQGAAGLSTGLSYVPGIYSNGDELVELSRAAAKAGGIYTTHSRSESMGLFDSVNECIRIAKEANIPVNISHFKCVGKVFWERCDKALAMIDEANAQGLDITLDAYPYVATSTTTLSVIPPKFLTEGGLGLARMLHDPNVVEEIRREIYEINDPSWDNSMYYVGLENFLIVKADKTPQFIGKTYAQAAKELGLEPFYAVMHLLRLNDGEIKECRFSMCEENVEAILRHPKCMVGSDGIYEKGDLSCHPRAMGTFPRYLGHYIRKRQILSREEGIRRITGMIAERYGLKGKGFVKVGMDADLVLFDYDSIIDRADFFDPFKANEGIVSVYMNGVEVLKNDQPTGEWVGKYLK